MSAPVPSPPRSAPPSGRRAQTRARLIEAADILFRAKGVGAVSLQQIAAHAGVTTGAIYGNFADKDDLVLAVATEKSLKLNPRMEPGLPLEEQLRRLGEAVVAALPAFQPYVEVSLDLRLHALSRESLRQRMAAISAANCARFATRLTDELKQTDLPMPAAQFAVVLDALLTGLMIQRALAPELVTDEVIIAALEALAG